MSDVTSPSGSDQLPDGIVVGSFGQAYDHLALELLARAHLRGMLRLAVVAVSCTGERETRLALVARTLARNGLETHVPVALGYGCHAHARVAYRGDLPTPVGPSRDLAGLVSPLHDRRLLVLPGGRSAAAGLLFYDHERIAISAQPPVPSGLCPPSSTTQAKKMTGGIVVGQRHAASFALASGELAAAASALSAGWAALPRSAADVDPVDRVFGPRVDGELFIPQVGAALELIGGRHLHTRAGAAELASSLLLS